MDAKLSKIWCIQPSMMLESSRRYQKTRRRGKISEDATKKWLIKQALWRINRTAPKHIPRPKSMCPRQMQFTKQTFSYHMTLKGVVSCGRGRKTYKYALTMVVVTRRFKETEPFTSNDFAEVASAFQKIYKPGTLK